MGSIEAYIHVGIIIEASIHKGKDAQKHVHKGINTSKGILWNLICLDLPKMSETRKTFYQNLLIDGLILVLIRFTISISLFSTT